MTYYELANSYYKLEEYKHAIYFCIEAINKKEVEGDSKKSIYNNIGCCYFELKDYENAKEYFMKGLKEQSDNYYNLGITFKKLFENEKAYESFIISKELSEKDGLTDKSIIDAEINLLLIKHPEYKEENKGKSIKEIYNFDIDLEYEILNLKQLINKALDENDKESFIEYSNKLNKLEELIKI